MKHLKKYLAGGLAASALAGSLVVGPTIVASPESGVVQTASAATYGQPGCIGDYRWKYSHTERWTRLRVFVETCDYRTSTGAIVQDARTGNVWKTW